MKMLTSVSGFTIWKNATNTSAVKGIITIHRRLSNIRKWWCNGCGVKRANKNSNPKMGAK
jgi:hypothetical protein